MKVSLFSQSLFALGLTEAIDATADLGFPAIELACTQPHLDRDTARKNAEGIAGRIYNRGLCVSALSLFNTFTDPGRLDEELEWAEVFIRLAPSFETEIIKLTPGTPASVDASEEHWQALQRALDFLVPLAREMGVRLAVETHMRQLTDTLASSLRLLEMAPDDTVGLTVDFSNLTFAGDDLCKVISSAGDRIFHAHLKNGIIDDKGNWCFTALDDGWTDYETVLPLLRDSGYDGFLSLECLGEDARQNPVRTARRDLGIFYRFLKQADWKVSE